MKNRGACLLCLRPRFKTKNGFCRLCHHRRKFDSLVANLNPLAHKPSAEIFKKYLNSSRARIITAADIVIVKEFYDYLRQNPIAPFKDWTDVIRVSRLANLRYKTRPGSGCPFLRVGRLLQELGEIAPIKSQQIIERSRDINALPEPMKSLMLQYFEKIKSRRPLICYGTISTTVKWHEFLDKKSLFKATQEDAVGFLMLFHKLTPIRQSTILSQMRDFYQWLKDIKYVSQNPFFALTIPRSKRICPRCKEERSYDCHRELCSICYVDVTSRSKLMEVHSEAKSLPPYQRSLFDLYLRYVRRYRVEPPHVHATQEFLSFLESKKDMPVLRSWVDLRRLTEEFKIFNNQEEHSSIELGCPVRKLGNILQELGVIAVHERGDFGRNVNERLCDLPPDLASAILKYGDLLRKSRRTEDTVRHTALQIKYFYLWLSKETSANLWLATDQMAQSYLLTLPAKDKNCKIRYSLRKFYKWAMRERYTLSNPFEKIPTVLPRQRLKICSPELTKKLEKFVRSEQAPPEHAILLVLVYYFGLTLTEISRATVEFENSAMKITLYRGPLSCGKVRYRRDEVLKLPIEPPWLLNLQKRFSIYWHEKFRTVRLVFPRRPLMLHSRGLHNRPLRPLVIRKRFITATEQAMGAYVTAGTIRRSGADLYFRHNGSGVLTRLGWSRNHAFRITWMPRELSHPK